MNVLARLIILPLVFAACATALEARVPAAPGDSESSPGLNLENDSAEAELKRLGDLHTQQVIDAHADRQDARSQAVTGMLLHMQSVRRTILDGDRTAEQTTQAAQQRDALHHLRRALELGQDDAVVLWNLAHIGPLDDGGALATEAAQRLVAVEPENASGWLQLLHLRRNELTTVEQDTLFARAADASHYGIHFIASTRMLAGAHQRVAYPSELIEHHQAQNGSWDVDAIAHVEAMAVLMALSLPAYHTITSGCGEDPAVRSRDACLALGTLMAEHSEELIGQYIGLAILRRTGADEEKVRLATRRIDWQQQAFAKLLKEVDPDSGMGWEILQPLWSQPGMSELEAARLALTAAGVPLEPPPDFRSAAERAAEPAEARSGQPD